MNSNIESFIKQLKTEQSNSVIPSVRNADQFRQALKSNSPIVLVLFGDILSLPEMVKEATAVGKGLFVHLDFIAGVGKDEVGIRFLSQMGIAGLITTKAYLCHVIRDSGMIAIQRLFLMDSESLRTGINLAVKYKPDIIEVLPGIVPAFTIERIKKETKLAVFGGGLIQTADDVQMAFDNGITAISTSNKDLWG